MSVPAAYKPSPLGYGSSPTRSSPFRRPESPASPSPLRHVNTTPNGSPTKPGPFGSTSSRFARPTTPTTQTAPPPWTPKAKAPEEDPVVSPKITKPTTQTTPQPSWASKTKTAEEDPVVSPKFGVKATTQTTPQPSWMPKAKPVEDEMIAPPKFTIPTRTPGSKSLGNGNALSQLQPAQVRTLRDGFQILDRDCDGVVNREDVADMLSQLGLPSGASDVSRFFPPSAPQTIALAAFLNSLAEALSALSPSAELLSAFSAFDDDDSGQVDLAELRNALLETAPEHGEPALTSTEVDKIMLGFTGRRAFNRNMNAHLGAKRGEVFKYQEFVGSIMGTNNSSEGHSRENSEN